MRACRVVLALVAAVASSGCTDDPTPDTPPVVTPPETTPTFSPLAAAGDSVLPEGLESCATYQQTQCVEGTLQRCAIYDTGASEFPAAPPAMTEQAFMFDRYHDLYHSANGQTMDFYFTQPVLAGTPESEWSKDEYFERYAGYGDSAGWTGTALWGAAARYQSTGTDADYERMLTALESMAFMYEVTGVPGLLARSHWAMLPEGAPSPKGHWGKSIVRYRDPGDNFDFAIAESLWPRLPDYYRGEIEIEGTTYTTTARYQTDASRDMYVRSLPGVMLAYDLLEEGDREERLRQVLKTELPATLNRMKKGRIYNLQQNRELIYEVSEYFSGPFAAFDEDDMEFTDLDEMIFYIQEQPHPGHLDEFDFETPTGPPMEFDPELEFDASDTFLFVVAFGSMIQREQGTGPVPIAWSMHPSVRATDTLFMTQWALAAHYLTGEERYLTFIEDLIESIDYEGALMTYGAVQLPKYCESHYAHSLGYPTIYNLMARIDAEKFPKFWALLSRMATHEARDKANGPREDPFFGVLYNRMATPATDASYDEYVGDMVELLSTYGMNPDDKLEPDRNYPRNFVDTPDPDVPLESIAEGDPEWEICENPIDFLGLELPAPRIDGIATRSVDPLPLGKRIGGTMLWQMDPWMVQREYGGVGMDEQWPMIGMTTPYWIGRADGIIDEGQGMALAWQSTEEACP